MKPERWTKFPERVWEYTLTPDGKKLWHSRPATREDHERRAQMAAERRWLLVKSSS